MGKFLFLVSFLAYLDPEYREAGDVSRRALLQTPMMKQEMVDLQDSAEKKLYRYGLSKDDLVYGAYAYPLFAGKVSSKPFKNFKYETKTKWILRPEIEYGLWNKEYSGFLILTKEF